MTDIAEAEGIGRTLASREANSPECRQLLAEFVTVLFCCQGVRKHDMLAVMPVLSSERSDFRKLVQRYGHEETDFVIVAESEDPVASGAAPYPEHGTVTIRCVKTQVERAYRTGMGTHWLADFEQDLQQRRFSN